ncbi:MAG: YbaB/EbfC family nucleoid-associated protein [Bacilli bacterium]|jgi:hypothetical protein|nr:YbaB/EbfC family nucleoid-associated protein [Bacilli bacterium]
MNIQAMMKQAKKLQQEITETKKELECKIFPGKYSYVEVQVNGKREVMKLKIDPQFEFDSSNIEILEDMIILAVNDALKKVEQEYNEKLGKFGSDLTGMM